MLEAWGCQLRAFLKACRTEGMQSFVNVEGTQHKRLCEAVLAQKVPFIIKVCNCREDNEEPSPCTMAQPKSLQCCGISLSASHTK